MLKKVLIISLLLSGWGLSAQLETSADFRRQVFDREYSFGIIGHTRGFAVNTRLLKFVDGFTKEGIEIDLVKLRHPKEVKTPNLGQARSSRGYVFNRVNSLFTIRTGYHYQKILFDKTDQGTVAITLVTSGGVSLGLVKPVFVQVPSEDVNPGVGGEIVVERYNPAEHNQSTIYGEANFFKGLGKTKIKPGLYVKLGMNFDYQLIEKKLTALEAGVIYDYFAFPQLGVAGDGFLSEVPIFYNEPGGENVNYTGFLQLYIAFNFGFRKN